MYLPLFIANRISKKTTGAFTNMISKIAIITIAIGLVVLHLSFMILYGFKDKIREKIFDFGGHLTIHKYTLSQSYEDRVITTNDTLIKILNNYPYIKDFHTYAMKAGILKTSEEVQGVIIKGIDSSFNHSNFEKHLKKGRFIHFSDSANYSTEILLSTTIANYLKLSIGDEVIIYFVQNPPRFRKLQVVGIYATGLSELDEKIIIGDLSLIQRINGWNSSEVGGIEIYLTNSQYLNKAEEDLFYTLDVNLYIDKATNKYAQIFGWLNLLNKNVIILLTIILIVSATSMISIILILIMERTQMIGLLKAAGASNRLIRTIFLWNGLRLIYRGLFWGNGVGLLLGGVQYIFKLIPLNETNYYMNHVPVRFDMMTILGLNLLVIILVGITLLIPITIISRVDPIKAIKFD